MKVLTNAVLLLAIVHFSSGQSMQISTYSAEAKELFIRGRDIFHLAWFEEAPKYLLQAIEKDSTLAVAHAYLALTEYFKFFDPSTSIAKAKIHANDATEEEKLLVKGWSFFIDGEYHKTARFMDSILISCPNDNYAAHIMGFSTLDGGDAEGAVEILSRLVRKDNPFAPANNHLAFSYHKSGDDKKALDAVNAFIAHETKNPSAYDTKGHIYFELGKYEEAILCFKKAALLDERFAYTQRFLGESLTMLNKPLLAVSAYQRALEMATEYHPSFKLGLYRRIAEARILSGDTNKVHEACLEWARASNLLNDNQGEISAIESLINFQLMTGQPESFKEISAKYNIGIENTELEIYYQAFASLLQGDSEQAKNLIAEGKLKMEQGILLQGLVYELEGNDNAIEYYTNLKDPGLYILSRLNRLYEKTGKLQDASKIRDQILNWQGSPNFDYVIAIFNLRKYRNTFNIK